MEDRIAAAVHELMPASFKDDHAKTNGFHRCARDTAAFDVRDGYEVRVRAAGGVAGGDRFCAPDGALSWRRCARLEHTKENVRARAIPAH